MALSFTKQSSEWDRGHGSTGRRVVREAFYLVEFDSSYPTGGEAFDPTSALATGDQLFHTVYHVSCDIDAAAKAVADTCIYDRTAGKLVLYVGGAEVANTTDCSSVDVYVKIEGI